MELVVNLVRQNVMGYNFNIKKCLQKFYALLIFMNGMDGSLFNRSISRTKENFQVDFNFNLSFNSEKYWHTKSRWCDLGLLKTETSIFPFSKTFLKTSSISLVLCFNLYFLLVHTLLAVRILLSTTNWLCLN